MEQDQEPVLEIPSGLVRIDAPDTLHGWKLVERGSAEHTAAVAALETDDAAKAAATSRRRS